VEELHAKDAVISHQDRQIEALRNEVMNLREALIRSGGSTTKTPKRSDPNHSSRGSLTLDVGNTTVNTKKIAASTATNGFHTSGLPPSHAYNSARVPKTASSGHDIIAKPIEFHHKREGHGTIKQLSLSLKGENLEFGSPLQSDAAPIFEDSQMKVLQGQRADMSRILGFIDSARLKFSRISYLLDGLQGLSNRSEQENKLILQEARNIVNTPR
jgi:hypothetical protein